MHLEIPSRESVYAVGMMGSANVLEQLDKELSAMNLSAKGGDPTTDTNICEAGCLKSTRATTVNRHSSEISSGGTRLGGEVGNAIVASAFERPAASARATQEAPFDEEV
jgi:hypothetical protein